MRVAKLGLALSEGLPSLGQTLATADRDRDTGKGHYCLEGNADCSHHAPTHQQAYD